MFNSALYFDFDGVVNATEPLHELVQEFHIPIDGSQHLAPVNHITYAPFVVETMERFRAEHGLELVWSTTWNEFNHVLKLAAYLGGLDGGRVLPAALNVEATNKAEWTAWKAEAIIADQAADPKPFVWVDDNAHQFWGDKVRELTSAPSLFITPNSHTGLTVEDLNAIDEFLTATE